jgi:STE24 endopeptidase
MIKTQVVSEIFLFALATKLVVELYLNLRNKNHIRKYSTEVPEKFAKKISLDDHKKAAGYSLKRNEFGRLNLFIDAALLYFWTIGGGLAALHNQIISLELGSLGSCLALYGSFTLIGLLISLPFSYYSTFVIEESFGFNKTTKKLFFIDLIKQVFIGALIGTPLIIAIIYFIESFPTNWWLYAWLFLTAFQFFLLWLYPIAIAPLFNKFSPLEDESINERVSNLAKKVDFAYSGLFVMDASLRSSHGNAYFTGVGKNRRIVFFDTLLKTLSPAEVEAVLAHELGHFKKKHILKGLLRSLALTFIGFYILGLLLGSPLFYEAHGLTFDAISKVYIGPLLFTLVMGTYTFFLTPLSSWWSRKYEYEADAFAAKHSNASDLSSALVKMYKDNASTLTPDPAFSSFYHSHPPAMQRIEHLEKL